MLSALVVLFSIPLLAIANPLPETSFAELAKRSKCWKGDGNCNQCIVNAREAWNRHESGQQFRRCYFSMVESLDGTLQHSPPDLQYGERHDIKFNEPLIGSNFMQNKISSYTDQIGRTGGPWCVLEGDLPEGPYCETAFYLGVATDNISMDACSKALYEWQRATDCMTG